MRNDFLMAVGNATDHARDTGAIKSISTTSHVVADQDMKFVVRIVENLARKERNSANSPGNPFLPYDEDLFVCDISDTHVCLLNKFNVVENHVLMVTRQFESQQSLLTVADFEALWFGLRSMDGLVFFNSSSEAGASQKHKHLQMIPCPLYPDRISTESQETLPSIPMAGCFQKPSDDDVICRATTLPFSHVYARVLPPQGRSDRECAERMRELYLAMLQTLGLWQPVVSPGEAQAPKPYNLLVSRDWLWVVPRRESHHQGIAVNALGYAGTLLLKNSAQLELLKQIGPMALLTAVN